MGYLPKALGDRFNAEREKFFNAPRRVYCPFCRVAGKGIHELTLSADGSVLFCPQCKDGRPATDEDRQVYGGSR